MCLAHFCDQAGFSFTRPGIPFAARWALIVASTASEEAPPAAAAPVMTRAATTRVRSGIRIGVHE
jgi:hypothetical protein